MAATTKRSSNKPKESKGQQGQKAKAAFQEYKNRMAGAGFPEAKGLQFGSNIPPMAPQGPTSSPFPPLPGGFPQGFSQWPNQPLMGQTPDPTLGTNPTLLAERVGETLSLGMQLLHSGLGVGVRFLQGLANTGSHHGHGEECGHHEGHGCSCHHASCCCEYQDCCQTMCCEPTHCCTPSVGSCC